MFACKLFRTSGCFVLSRFVHNYIHVRSHSASLVVAYPIQNAKSGTGFLRVVNRRKERKAYFHFLSNTHRSGGGKGWIFTELQSAGHRL